MALPIPAEVLGWVGEATSDPELQAWLLAIAGAESRWQANGTPNCNSLGCDWGLFQMHQAGPTGSPGMGDNYTRAQILDGRWITAEMARYFEAQRARGRSLYDATQPWTTRDQNNGLGTVPQLAQRIKAEGWVPIGAAAGGPAASPAPGPAAPAATVAGGVKILPLLLLGAAVVVLLDD